MENRKFNKRDIGDLVSINDLEVNDLFWMTYGYGTPRFRVHKVFEDGGRLCHSVTWCKDSSILIESNTDRHIYYAGKMSKFRSWFLL